MLTQLHKMFRNISSPLSLSGQCHQRHGNQKLKESSSMNSISVHIKLIRGSFYINNAKNFTRYIMHFTHCLSAVVTVFLAYAPLVHCSPYVISDDRVRSLDITPVLGRGYSIMTNSYQSTCLEVTNTTIPSYNYDCKFILWW